MPIIYAIISKTVCAHRTGNGIIINTLPYVFRQTGVSKRNIRRYLNNNFADKKATKYQIENI